MATSVTLTVQGGSLDGEEYVIDHRGPYVVGRKNDCGIQLPAWPEFLTVSRHHCVIDVDPSNARVRDCGSRNGTRVNGMQIGHPAAWTLPRDPAALPFAEYQLRDGDELQVGDVIFRVRVTSVPENRSERALEVVGGPC
jgi:pSer/pThr/pTyr-binding forkhead associated (FHA) protein